MTVITASPTSFQQLLQLQRVSIEHLDSIRSLLQTGDPTAQLKILEKLEQLSNASAKTQAEQLQVSNTTNVINEKNVEKNVDNVKSLESKIEALKIISKESLKTQTEALKTAHEQSKISVESQVTSRESFTTLQPMGERSIKTEVEIKAELKAMRADNAKALKQQIEAITTQHNTHTDEQATIVAKTSETTEEFKSISEKLSEFKESVKGSVTGAFKGMREAPGAMIKGATQGMGSRMVSSGLLKKGGITDTLFGISKREARNEFVKKQQAFDSEKSVPELQQDFVLAGKTASNIKGNAAKIEDLKKTTGLSEQDIGKLKEGRALLDEKAKLTTEYAKHDKAGQFAADSLKEGRSEAEHKNNPDPVYRSGKKKLVENTAVLTSGSSRADTPRVAAAESIESGRIAVQSEEDKNEHLLVLKEQSTLLSKIEENTRLGAQPSGKTSAKKEATEEKTPSILDKAMGVAGNAASAAGSWLSKKGGKLGALGKVLGMGGALAGGAEVVGAGTLGAGVEALTPATGILSKGASLAKGLAGGVGGIVGGLALDYASDKLKESGHEKLGAATDIGSSALSGAGTGAMIGSIVPGVGTMIGGAVGGLVGGAYGLYKNAGTLFGDGAATRSASQELQTRPIDFGIGSTWGPAGAAGRSASQELQTKQIDFGIGNSWDSNGAVDKSTQVYTTQKGAIQEAADAVKAGKAPDYNSQLDLTNTIIEKYGKDLSPQSKTMLEGQVRRSIQDSAANITSNTADMVKPTTNSGVIVNNLSGKVDALKELAPQVANNTVIAPSNTTVNNTTNTSKIFPPTRIQDQSMDRYRYSRATY